MLNIIEKLFGGNSEERANKKLLAANEKKNKAMISSLNKHLDYDVKLQKCDEEFRRVIEREKILIRERNMNGLSVEGNKKRVRQAAIGRIVVRTARGELKQGANSERLKNAMNGLGISLCQLHKLHKTDVKKKNLEAIMTVLGNSGDDIAEAKMYLEHIDDDTYEVPKETNALVDDTFVDELLATDNLEYCIKQGRQRYEARKNEAENKGTATQEKTDGAEDTDDIDPRDIKVPPKENDSGEKTKKTSDNADDPKDAYKKISKENTKFY